MKRGLSSGKKKIMCIESRIMSKSVKAKARVKVFTDFGYWCLAEIRGLKEGTELEGRYNPVNNAFDFIWHGQDAMLWIGQNGELIESSIINNED